MSSSTPLKLELRGIRKTFKSGRNAVPVLDGLSLKVMIPQLDPAVVEAATMRRIAGKVCPDSVDITPEALRTGLNTQIYLGNLKHQPDYNSFLAHKYIEAALSGK